MIVKIKNGFIRLEQPIYRKNFLVSVIGFIISSNLINIQTECSISIWRKIIVIKQGKYCKNKLNNISKPLIFSIKIIKLI